ncbi:MAG: ISLre2 family transposase [Lachnospiraceae bacterium]|nr:ISLre2 family transposase [Lachnospiraceae bacterium]
MENIISYLAGDFISDLEKVRADIYKDPTAMAVFVKNTRKATDELARRFIEETVKEIGKTVDELPERKRSWVADRKDTKKLATSVGIVTFDKTLYRSKKETDENGRPLYCYLLDRVMGFEPNQTMTEDVREQAYKETVQTSFRKGGEAACPEGLSKATIKKLIHGLEFPPNFKVPEKKKTVEYLYIDADEDHYRLQFQNRKGDLKKSSNGRKCNGAINKIIYVFEDIVPEAPKSKRHRLVNTHYFCRGEEQDNGKLWAEVFSYIEATYDLDKVKCIYINADGGSWIKTGYTGYAGAVFVLDEFHLSKYIAKLTGHMKDSAEDARQEVYDCIRNMTEEDFWCVVERLKGCAETDDVSVCIDKAAEYLISNWTAAKYRLRKENGIKACSAEGHVYHVLSSRMSTQPMGWSRHGGSQMARLREYYYNGGDMFELAMYQKKELPTVAGAEEVVLTAHTVIEKKSKRGKLLREYAKYSEIIQHSLSPQSSKMLAFRLNATL